MNGKFSTDAEAEAPILWHLMRGADSLEKALMLGMLEGQRRSRWQRMRWLDSVTDSVDMSLIQFWGIAEDSEA